MKYLFTTPIYSEKIINKLTNTDNYFSEIDVSELDKKNIVDIHNEITSALIKEIREEADKNSTYVKLDSFFLLDTRRDENGKLQIVFADENKTAANLKTVFPALINLRNEDALNTEPSFKFKNMIEFNLLIVTPGYALFQEVGDYRGMTDYISNIVEKEQLINSDISLNDLLEDSLFNYSLLRTE